MTRCAVTFEAARVVADDLARAHGLHAHDVDGDGDVDLVSASYVASTVAWHENTADGAFLTHAITTTAAGAHAVHGLRPALGVVELRERRGGASRLARAHGRGGLP